MGGPVLHRSRRGVGRSIVATLVTSIAFTTALPLARATGAEASDDDASRPSRAPVESIVLTYRTDGRCPDEPAFVEKVHAYTTTPWTRVPEGTSGARVIRVFASARARSRDGLGKLTISTTNGKTSERQLVGPSCEAVAHALAIMVAVAIDPQAEASSGSSEPSEKPGGPSDDDEARHDAPTPAPALGEARPSAPTVDRPRPAAGPIEGPARSSWRLTGAVHAGVTTAVVDASMIVLGASIEALPERWTSRSLPTWLRPSVAVGIRQSMPTELSRNGGSISFVWTAGNVRLCPLRLFLLDDVVETSLCAETNLGRLGASASDFDQSRRSAIPWIDVGGSMWVGVRLTKRSFLSATMDVVAPYSRRRFELSSGALVSRAPALGLLAGLGLGVEF